MVFAELPRVLSPDSLRPSPGQLSLILMFSTRQVIGFPCVLQIVALFTSQWTTTKSRQLPFENHRRQLLLLIS